MASSSYPFILHTTPPVGSLPASDPESIYLAALLHLGAPGRFALQTADWGDNGGSLPYITHLEHKIRQRHLASVPSFQDPDERLSEDEKADSLAWSAYIDQHLTDLVNHTIYSLPPNYPDFAKSQFSSLTFPQSHYIPQRIRAIHKSRLSHAGLWGLGGVNAGDAAEEDRKRVEDNFVSGPGGTMAPRAWTGWRAGAEFAERRKKVGEEELVRRARGVLDPLARRLKGGYFFDRPSKVDLRLYSHLSLLLTPLPNPLLADLLRSTYPALIQHHDRIAALVPAPPRIAASTPTTSWWQLWPGSSSSSPSPKAKAKTSKDKSFERARWAWFATAGFGMIAYLFASGIVQIDFGGGSESEDGDGDGEWRDGSELEDDDEEEEEMIEIIEVEED